MDAVVHAVVVEDPVSLYPIAPISIAPVENRAGQVVDVELSVGHAYEAPHRLHELVVLRLKKAAEAPFGNERPLAVVEGGATDGAGDTPLVGFSNEREDSGKYGCSILLMRQPLDQPQRFLFMHHFDRCRGSPDTCQSRASLAEIGAARSDKALPPRVSDSGTLVVV